jgi:hypothetical protein
MAATAKTHAMRPVDAGAQPEPDGVVRVRDRQGALVFEFDPETGRAVLHVPVGDLSLSVPAGAVTVAARDGVRVETPGRVSLSGAAGVQLTAPPSEGAAGSSVVLDARGTAVATHRLDARAQVAELNVGEGRVVARTLHTAVEHARQVAGVVELQAQRVIERAKNVYRDVEDLAQTRAGRVRVVAQQTFHLLGKRAFLKAEEDMKIRGEKIHLG